MQPQADPYYLLPAREDDTHVLLEVTIIFIKRRRLFMFAKAPYY